MHVFKLAEVFGDIVAKVYDKHFLFKLEALERDISRR